MPNISTLVRRLQGSLPLAPSQRGVGGGVARRGVPARRGVWGPAGGVLRPVPGQEAWEHHEPGAPTSRDPRRILPLGHSLGTSDFQSEVGEVFGEIGGELPAKFGRRFSRFFCWENRQNRFHQNSTANSTIKLHYEVLGCGGA